MQTLRFGTADTQVEHYINVSGIDLLANDFFVFFPGEGWQTLLPETAYAHKRLENQGFQDMMLDEISSVNWS